VNRSRSCQTLWATVVLALVAAAAPAAETRQWLDWQSLPPLPDPIGVAGPFVGSHQGGLIVAGGANFAAAEAADLWEVPKRFHQAAFVMAPAAGEAGGYAWRTGFALGSGFAWRTRFARGARFAWFTLRAHLTGRSRLASGAGLACRSGLTLGTLLALLALRPDLVPTDERVGFCTVAGRRLTDTHVHQQRLGRQASVARRVVLCGDTRGHQPGDERRRGSERREPPP